MRGSAALAFLALALLAAPALADHVYTHRYVVSGRLVDAEGQSRGNASVELVVDDVSSLRGDCRAYRDEMRVVALGLADPNRTNAFGDFEACVHVHGIRATSVARLRVGEATFENVTVDAGTRLSFHVPPPEAAGVTGEKHLLLRARVWRPSATPLVLDGVRAGGEAVPRQAVAYAVDFPAGRVEGTLTTDRYGDAAVYVNASGAGNVTYRLAGIDPVVVPFEPGRMRADAVLRLPEDSFTGNRPAPEDDPPVAVPAASVLATVAAAAFALARRR